MIDFKKCKQLLLPALMYYGFNERKDKSCQKYRVFSNGSESIIVKRDIEGHYTKYINSCNSQDFGDAIQFVASRIAGHPITLGNMSAQQLRAINQQMQFIGAQEMLEEQLCDTVESKVLNIKEYDVNPLSTPAPKEIKRFFDLRQLYNFETFADSIYTITNKLGFKNPAFLWTDAEGKTCGLQQKYIYKGKCVKLFLPGSDKDNAIWQTPITTNIKTLFVTEDPLDAIAHSQLYNDNSIAYACTGGTSTPKQRELILNLVDKHNLKLCLGNDNDLSGQIENLKMLYTFTGNITANKQDVYIRKDNVNNLCEIEANGATLQLSLDKLKDYIIELANDYVGIAIPHLKDWNDDTKVTTKSANLSSIEKSATKKEQSFSPSDNLEY